jgi:hypothetical protein
MEFCQRLLMTLPPFKTWFLVLSKQVLLHLGTYHGTPQLAEVIWQGPQQAAMHLPLEVICAI